MPDPMLKFRRVHYVDARSGAPMRASIPATKAVSDASSDGHDDATEDLYLGGSGGVVNMIVVSYHQDATHGDYVVCQPPGTTAEADRENVGLEPQLQSGLPDQTNPDGNTWHHSAYDEILQKRTSTCTAFTPVTGRSTVSRIGAVLTEYISPPFNPGDVIPVQSCSNPGVEVLDPDLGEYIPVTRQTATGRHWASA